MSEETHLKQNAKFAFFYLLSLVALVFSSLSTGIIIFQIINKNIVDVLEPFSGRFSDDALKFAISALIISAPIFYVTTARIQKNLKSGALKRDSGVRRWLTYFILLVASVVMIVWLIITLNTFLGGELTLKFALKALTAVGIAAIIFTYYLLDIRQKEEDDKQPMIIRSYFIGTLTIIVAAFAWSLLVVESPAEARDRRFDQLVIDDFNELSLAIDTYYNNYQKLPESLTQLEEEYNYISNDTLEDPVTKEMYEYKIVSEDKYELCATFRASSSAEENLPRGLGDRWPHQAGRQCISQKVNKIPVKEVMPEPLPVN